MSGFIPKPTDALDLTDSGGVIRPPLARLTPPQRSRDTVSAAFGMSISLSDGAVVIFCSQATIRWFLGGGELVGVGIGAQDMVGVLRNKVSPKKAQRRSKCPEAIATAV